MKATAELALAEVDGKLNTSCAGIDDDVTQQVGGTKHAVDPLLTSGDVASASEGSVCKLVFVLC
jgi:hypothetical protein